MFGLYCDARRQCDISDILNTARTLGFDKKYKIVYGAIADIVTDLNGEWVDFEIFLTLLTNKLVHSTHNLGKSIYKGRKISNV